MKIRLGSLELNAFLFLFLGLQPMQPVLEEISDSSQLRQKDINRLRLPIPKQCSELTLIILLLCLYSLKHLRIFFIFLSTQQYKLILLPIPILNHLIQVLRPVV